MYGIYAEEHFDADTAWKGLGEAENLLVHRFVNPAEVIDELVVELLPVSGLTHSPEEKQAIQFESGRPARRSMCSHDANSL